MFPLPPWVVFVAVFAVAFIVSWALTPAAARLSRRLGIVAVPGGRRHHEGVIPRLGGVPIYGGFMIAVLATWFYPRSPDDRFRLVGLLLGATVILVGGLLDDRFQFSALPQMAISLLAALIAIRFTVFIQIVNNPLTNLQIKFPLVVTVILTLLWMAGMVTTVNWMDGLDGLAVGVSAIAVLVFFVHMLRTGQTSVALLPLALLGALLGFLPRNWYPASIHLGSAGAYFLGFAVGGLSIIGGARAATALLVLGVPILDVAWQIFDRVRRGRSPGAGDRGHLHFRLADLGLPTQRIVLLYYALSAAFGGLALLMPSRLYKLLALVALGLVVVAVLATLTRAGEKSAAEDKPDPGD